MQRLMMTLAVGALLALVGHAAAVAQDTSAGATIAGRVLEDKNDNGVVDDGDAPPSVTQVREGSVGTLVELVSSASQSIPLYTGTDGSFTFTNVPSGDYTLWIWWTPGFVADSAQAGTIVQQDLLQVPFTVKEDGTVDGPAALEVLLKPRPEGLIPFPVKTGLGGGPIAIGALDVGRTLGTLPAALPGTGGGPPGSDGHLLRWLGVTLLAIGLVSGLLLARRKVRA